ncbi:unnamed protein product [Dicrocoelium dendriticum]|nr:unnamed protein product [Dicrocoelium dendriticum]
MQLTVTVYDRPRSAADATASRITNRVCIVPKSASNTDQQRATSRLTRIPVDLHSNSAIPSGSSITSANQDKPNGRAPPTTKLVQSVIHQNPLKQNRHGAHFNSSSEATQNLSRVHLAKTLKDERTHEKPCMATPTKDIENKKASQLGSPSDPNSPSEGHPHNLPPNPAGKFAFSDGDLDHSPPRVLADPSRFSFEQRDSCGVGLLAFRPFATTHVPSAIPMPKTLSQAIPNETSQITSTVAQFPTRCKGGVNQTTDSSNLHSSVPYPFAPSNTCPGSPVYWNRTVNASVVPPSQWTMTAPFSRKDLAQTTLPQSRAANSASWNFAMTYGQSSFSMNPSAAAPLRHTANSVQYPQIAIYPTIFGTGASRSEAETGLSKTAGALSAQPGNPNPLNLYIERQSSTWRPNEMTTLTSKMISPSPFVPPVSYCPISQPTPPTRGHSLLASRTSEKIAFANRGPRSEDSVGSPRQSRHSPRKLLLSPKLTSKTIAQVQDKGTSNMTSKDSLSARSNTRTTGSHSIQACLASVPSGSDIMSLAKTTQPDRHISTSRSQMEAQQVGQRQKAHELYVALKKRFPSTRQGKPFLTTDSNANNADIRLVSCQARLIGYENGDSTLTDTPPSHAGKIQTLARHTDPKTQTNSISSGALNSSFESMASSPTVTDCNNHQERRVSHLVRRQHGNSVSPSMSTAVASKVVEKTVVDSSIRSYLSNELPSCGYISDGDVVLAPVGLTPSSNDARQPVGISSLPRHYGLSVISEKHTTNVEHRDITTYARLMQHRMQEGMRAVQESLKLPYRTNIPSHIRPEEANSSTFSVDPASTGSGMGYQGKLSSAMSVNACSHLNAELQELESLNTEVWTPSSTASNVWDTVIPEQPKQHQLSVHSGPSYSSNTWNSSATDPEDIHCHISSDSGARVISRLAKWNSINKCSEDCYNSCEHTVRKPVQESKDETLMSVSSPDARDGQTADLPSANSKSDTEEWSTRKLYKSNSNSNSNHAAQKSIPHLPVEARRTYLRSNPSREAPQFSNVRSALPSPVSSESTFGSRKFKPNPDMERIYGVATTRATTWLRRTPKCLEKREVYGLETEPKQAYADGSASAPPGTPIRLPYTPAGFFTGGMELAQILSPGVEESTLSLPSGNSHASRTENRQLEEIRILRQRLKVAEGHVTALTSQLITNAQVVSAFEQSLNSMSQRLQTLTHTTAKKDSELHTLRSTIEALRTQSGLGFSKLLHAKVGRSLEEKSDEKYPETEQASHPISGTSSLSLNQQDVASSGRLSPVNQSSYSAESSPKKTPLTDTKSIPVIGLKKNSWFRASIGKAFRKRSPATSSVNCVTSPASPQQTHGSVDAQIPSDHLHSVTGVGTMCSRFPLEATTPNQWSKPDPTPIMGQPIGRLNGLSPSVSSTSSSSTSGSRWNHEVNAAVWPTNNACSSYCSTDPHPSHADVATHLGTFPPSKSVSCRNSRAGAQSAVVAPTEHSFGAEALRKPTTSGVSFAPSKKVNNIPMTANFSPYPSQLHALESEVCRLRGQLSERESKLTDVQLEALASTHQVNQLRDQLLRMEEELQRLRSDNHRLQSLVRGGTDTPAAISTQPASRLENDVDPSKLTPLPCVSDENNEWPVESELDILFAVSHKSGKNPDEFQTKRLAVVSLVPDAEAELRSINIGLVDLKQFAHWVDLDKHLTQMFVAYTRLINPHGELDTRINTILGYRIVTHSTPQNGDVYEHWIRSGESVGNSEEETALATLLKQNSIENGTTQIALLFRADSNGFSVRLPLFFLLPAARLECCLSLLHRYRRIVLCHSNEFAAQTEMLAFSLARCLQESGRVAECHRFHLGRSNDPVGEAERCVSSTNTNKPVAIVLHQLDCITSQQFINMLRSSTDQMAASFNGEGHFLIGTVLESISPPDEAELLPVDSCLVRWNTNSCCWISSQWKEFDVCKLYLSCSLRQRIVHLAVAESSDLKECDTLRFSHTSPIRAHLEWLQKVWEKIRQQHTNAILPPNVFDDVPLSDLEQWFIYKWNNQIARHLRAETKDGSCAGELIDWICSTWPTKEGREKLRQQLTPSQT